MAAAQPALDTLPEKLQAPIPDGYVGTPQSDKTQMLVEFVRKSESRDAWTDLYTVLIVKHARSRPIKDALEAIKRGMVAGCAVAPAADLYTLPRDGFDAGTGLVLCGKTRRFGTGEAFAFKVIEGERAEYNVPARLAFSRRREINRPSGDPGDGGRGQGLSGASQGLRSDSPEQRLPPLAGQVLPLA